MTIPMRNNKGAGGQRGGGQRSGTRDEGAITGDSKPLLIYSDQPKVASGQQ